MALEEIRKTKIEKVEAAINAGLDPYPAVCNRTHKISEALADFERLSQDKKIITLAGRVMAMREHGGSVFFDIDDGSETDAANRLSSDGQIQVHVKEDVIGKEKFGLFKTLADIGDFLEIRGFLFKTKKEERTLETEDFRLLSKALLPLPEKWHGLQDVEERYRKRYLDMLFNKEIKHKFMLRFKIIGLLRDFFKDNGFLEVETPILQPLAGGASARPFKTHMNDLNVDLYLRIAPELYLKRLLVGGMEKVFEIAKNFRNEGMDREHNPEFNMLEAYAAYKDYRWMMELTEKMMEFLTREIFGKTEVEYGGAKIDFKKPYKRLQFNDIIKKYAGLDYDTADGGDFKKRAGELGLKIEKTATKENIADEIYKKLARPQIINPVFVVDHPLELSPLAKKLPENAGHVARFQLLAAGFELTNAFSELNDPQDQLERFRLQEQKRKKGDEEAQRLDKDFVEALEYGMPPAAGIGIGIDRLVALLTDSHSLREILLFPIMKQKE